MALAQELLALPVEHCKVITNRPAWDLCEECKDREKT